MSSGTSKPGSIIANRWPSGERKAVSEMPVGNSRCRTSLPLPASNSFTIRPRVTVTIVLPSGVSPTSAPAARSRTVPSRASAPSGRGSP
jgi:hypothetical protein